MALLKAPNLPAALSNLTSKYACTHCATSPNIHLTHQEVFWLSQSKCECASLFFVFFSRGVFVSFRGLEGDGCNGVRTNLKASLAGWGQSANSWVCSLLAPVANTFPPVTQSHVRQENENCYCSGSLHLNQRRANFQLGQRNVQLMKTSAPPLNAPD